MLQIYVEGIQKIIQGYKVAINLNDKANPSNP